MHPIPLPPIGDIADRLFNGALVRGRIPITREELWTLWEYLRTHGAIPGFPWLLNIFAWHPYLTRALLRCVVEHRYAPLIRGGGNFNPVFRNIQGEWEHLLGFTNWFRDDLKVATMAAAASVFHPNDVALAGFLSPLAIGAGYPPGAPYPRSQITLPGPRVLTIPLGGPPGPYHYGGLNDLIARIRQYI